MTARSLERPSQLDKQCGKCGHMSPRTAPRCKHCGTVFLGHAKLLEIQRAKAPDGKIIKPGRKPRQDFTVSDEVAADAERQLIALAASKGPAPILPEDPMFLCRRLQSGGVTIAWPTFNIKLTLSPAEAGILFKALTG